MADGSRGASKKRHSEGMASPASRTTGPTVPAVVGSVVTPNKAGVASPSSASTPSRKERQRRSGSPVFVPPTSGRRSRKQTRARTRTQQHRHRATHRPVASPVATSSPAATGAAAAAAGGGGGGGSSSGRHLARRPASTGQAQGTPGASHYTRGEPISHAAALRRESTPPRRKPPLHRQESEDDAASIRAGFTASSTTPRHRPRRRPRINQVVQSAPTTRGGNISHTHSDDARTDEAVPAVPAKSTRGVHRWEKPSRRRPQREKTAVQTPATTEDNSAARVSMGDPVLRADRPQDRDVDEPNPDNTAVNVDRSNDNSDDDDDDDDDDLPSVFGPPRPRSRLDGLPDANARGTSASSEPQEGNETKGGEAEGMKTGQAAQRGTEKKDEFGKESQAQLKEAQATTQQQQQRQQQQQHRDAGPEQGRGQTCTPTTQVFGTRGAEEMLGTGMETKRNGRGAISSRNSSQELEAHAELGKENKEPQAGFATPPSDDGRCEVEQAGRGEEVRPKHGMVARADGEGPKGEESGHEQGESRAGGTWLRRATGAWVKRKEREEGDEKEEEEEEEEEKEEEARGGEQQEQEGQDMEETQEGAEGLQDSAAAEKATDTLGCGSAGGSESARSNDRHSESALQGASELTTSHRHQAFRGGQQPLKQPLHRGGQQQQQQQQQRPKQRQRATQEEDSEEGMGTPPLFSQVPDAMAGLVSPSATLNSTMQPTATASMTATARHGTASPTQQTAAGSSTQHISTEPTSALQSDTPRISLHSQAQLSHPFRVKQVDVLSSEEGVVVAAWCADAIAVWRREQSATRHRRRCRVQSPVTLAFHQQFEPDEEEISQVVIVSHQTIFVQRTRGALRAVDVQSGDVFDVSVPGVTLGSSQSFDEDSHTLLHQRVHYGRVCTVHNDEMTGRVGGCVFTWSDARRCAVAPVTLHDRRSADPCTAVHVGKAEAGLRNCDLIFAQCEDSLFVWRACDGSALGRLQTQLSQMLVPKDVLALPTPPVLLHVRVGAATADAQQQVALRESDRHGRRQSGANGHAGQEEEEEEEEEEGEQRRGEEGAGLSPKRARRTRQPLQTCLQATMLWITSADTGAVAVVVPAHDSRQAQSQSGDNGNAGERPTLLRPIAQTESVLDAATLTWLQIPSCPTLALSFQSPSPATQQQQQQQQQGQRCDASNVVSSAFVHGRLLLSFFKTGKVVVSCTDTLDVVHEQQLHAETGASQPRKREGGNTKACIAMVHASPHCI